MSTHALARPQTDVRHVLARILDEPTLVADVRSLPPAALAKLIVHIGLEDAGEIVALATTEQIERVFDEDLWTRKRAGDDEAFDAERFVVWLEILLEAGEGAAARRLGELSADVVTLAFHRLVSVVDLDVLAEEVTDEIEQALEDALSHELGQYMIVARHHDGWDAIVQSLAAFDEHDHDTCTRLLDRLVAMTEREADDEGGLHEVLSAGASLMDDVQGDRNERRAKEGFLAPADARAFLELARESSDERGRDPVTKAYFRELDRSAPVRDVPLLRLLKDAGVLGKTTLKKKANLLPSPEKSLLAGLVDAERMEELAYLVNVLVSGDKKPWRPADAAESVVAIVLHGLAEIAAASGRTVATIVAEDGLVPAFRIGVRAGKLDERNRDRRR